MIKFEQTIEKIEKYLWDNRLTYRAGAKVFGLHYSTLWRLLKGKRDINLRNFQKVESTLAKLRSKKVKR